MSQSKRSRVRAMLRHREQVARLIAEACFHISVGRSSDGTWTAECTEMSLASRDPSRTRAVAWVRRAVTHALVDDRQAFNVALAREYGERLVAEGDRNEASWVAFIDWTREQGRGPNTGRPCGVCLGNPVDGNCLCNGTGHRGGWPGNLAAEWARGPGRVKCGTCRGAGKLTCVTLEDETRTLSYEETSRTEVDCSDCMGRGTIEGPRPKPGSPMIRMGKRLLAALEGQPSECQHARCEHGKVDVGYHATTYRSREECQRDCDALSQIHQAQRMAAVERVVHREPRQHGAVWRIHDMRECGACHGSGHNLAGVLPPIEWSPSIRRGLSDAVEATRDSDRVSRRAEWQTDLIETLPRGWGNFDTEESRSPKTRVVPRGQHRERDALCRPSLMYLHNEPPPLDVRVTSRGLDPTAPQDRMPDWFRGELRHAKERRARRWETMTAPELHDDLAGALRELMAGHDLDGAAANLAITRRADESVDEFRERVLAAQRLLRPDIREASQRDGQIRGIVLTLDDGAAQS